MISAWKKERKKTWTLWSLAQGPPLSTTLLREKPGQQVVTKRFLESGTVLDAEGIKVSKVEPMPSKVSGWQGKQKR